MLITLVVIGIIAAITVPVITASHKKVETAAKLKKFYSTLSNAVKLSEIETGNRSYEWEYNTCADYDTMKTYYYTYLLNNINYINIVKMSDNVPYFNQIDYKYKDLIMNSPIVYLNDGSLFFGAECPMEITYDVNGEKGPNKMGRDIFQFNIFTDIYEDGYEDILEKIPHVNTYVSGTSTDGFYPNNYKNYQKRNYVLETCKESGFWCSHLLEIDGWEFKDDYPYKL